MPSGKRAKAEELTPRIGVNYDCCHLAIEREDASVGLSALLDAGIRVSKLHLSSALSLEPTERNLRQLEDYVEEVYLHQVITSREGKVIERIKDLDVALEKAKDPNFSKGDEWRVHFHVPLHASPGEGLRDTRSHVLATLDWLSEHPKACAHLEMETYTWEVLPAKLRSDSVIEQVAREYQWTLELLVKEGWTIARDPNQKNELAWASACFGTGFEPTHGLVQRMRGLCFQCIGRADLAGHAFPFGFQSVGGFDPAFPASWGELGLYGRMHAQRCGR